MAEQASYPVFMGEKVEVSHAISAELGEGSLWHEGLQAYLHVDIYGPSKLCPGPAVYIHNPYDATAPVRVFPVPSFCGTVVPHASGGLVVALKDGLYSLDLDTGATSLLVDPEGVRSNRFNEGKCAPDGRLWVGTMGEPGKVLPGVGALYCVEGAGKARKAVGGITISNGLAWDTARGVMYYIDTVEDAVRAYDYDAATGEISNQRQAFAIPPGTGHPDGCCLDSDGNLWVAQWGGSRVVAYRPADGSIVATVHLPAAHVSSCTFGGPGLKDLYITTAKEHLSAEQRAEQPEAGNCFMVRNIGWTGVPAGVFTG